MVSIKGLHCRPTVNARGSTSRGETEILRETIVGTTVSESTGKTINRIRRLVKKKRSRSALQNSDESPSSSSQGFTSASMEECSKESIDTNVDTSSATPQGQQRNISDDEDRESHSSGSRTTSIFAKESGAPREAAFPARSSSSMSRPMRAAPTVTVGNAIEEEIVEFEEEEEGGKDDSLCSTATSPAPVPARGPGSLLEFESPLNLRLGTLTRHAGRAFRGVTVSFPVERGGTMDFDLTFEDIASGSQLVCKLSEVKSLYMDWVAQFRATIVALFVPTLQHPSAVLLQHALLSGKPPRDVPSESEKIIRINEDADHFFFSYEKIKQMIISKHEKIREEAGLPSAVEAPSGENATEAKSPGPIPVPLLMLTLMNTTADEWHALISAPYSCVPQEYLLASYQFRAAVQATTARPLNRELLLSQLSAAAQTLLYHEDRELSRDDDEEHKAHVLSVAGSIGRRGVISLRVGTQGSGLWRLIFVAAGGGKVQPSSHGLSLQDLMLGQFVEPITLATQPVLYVIGGGEASALFHQVPKARKGKPAISIMLQDIESQLGSQRPHRPTLSSVLTFGLEYFSRLTWMGLMEVERGQRRVPRDPKKFFLLQRRSVKREVLPPFLEEVFGGGKKPSENKEEAASAVIPHPASSPQVFSFQPALHSLTVDVERYVSSIFNNPQRLAREQSLYDDIRGCQVFLVHLHSANITAARRADNPFSSQNGVLEAWVHKWEQRGSDGTYASSITRHIKTREEEDAHPTFLDPDAILPPDFPTKPSTHPNPLMRASKGILVAWDLKRVVLFLRSSPRMREFLFNGGRVWCAQYAQYLLRGFDHHHLVTIDRTFALCNDSSKASSGKALSPVGKLRVVVDMQLKLALYGRQLISIAKRMDGLLASAEMEGNGLRIVPQKMISKFGEELAAHRETLEKTLQEKIMDFCKNMDENVRNKINFRSPQDISTIIYGGALFRYLNTQFIPIRPEKLPITSLLPHFVCQISGKSLPTSYTQSESLISQGPSAAKAGVMNFPFTKREVEDAIRAIRLCCTTHVHRTQKGKEVLLANTAVVVVICKASMGGMLERLAIYCPTTDLSPATKELEDGEAKSEEGKPRPKPLLSDSELNVRVAIDDVIPTSNPPGKPPLMTVMQVRKRIRKFHGLLQLRQALEKPGPLNVKPIRNVLILTNCSAEKLEVLVDCGIIQAIQETVLGSATPPSHPSKKQSSASSSSDASAGKAMFAPPIERVCFADLAKIVPPSLKVGESFESDFTDLTSGSSTVQFSARETWLNYVKDYLEMEDLHSLLLRMLLHSGTLLGSPRDPFRSSHPLPSALPQGVHGQERCSTDGLLWMATPPSLHPVLKSFLRGRVASSGADAIERVTVFLSPYKKHGIDLSFFKTLQQLRFDEKKLQLFEEGCLFRAVLPECHDRVHGEFCHCVTATGRLSSQSPNLQNIPREEDLRRLFVSRFGTQEGRMIEADYSQLEVIVLALLSKDRRMTEEIQRRVDFHCLRVSLMLKEPYESVERKVKKLKDPHYIQLRQQAKVFSFQRQYGAGAATIAATTGLLQNEVDSLIAAEESHYSDLSTYYQLVESTVNAGSERLQRLRKLDKAVPTHLRRVVLLTTPKNYFVVPTGSRFNLQKDKRSSPKLKNYPVQGLAGEIVQIMCGELLRHFYKTRNYNQRAFLVNTVHDCVWVDCHKSVEKIVMRDVASIMGSTQQRLAAIWPDVTFDVPFNASIQHGPSLGELSSN